jgi:hypothetical protein
LFGFSVKKLFFKKNLIDHWATFALLLWECQGKRTPERYSEKFCLFIAQILSAYFSSAAELSASWQHNTALAGAAGQETPKNHSKKT